MILYLITYISNKFIQINSIYFDNIFQELDSILIKFFY
jgi:hypothetical protein